MQFPQFRNHDQLIFTREETVIVVVRITAATEMVQLAAS
jgi:hypothetical protein